jgi:hypothetical protein
MKIIVLEDFSGNIEDSDEDYACCKVDSLVGWLRAITNEERIYHALHVENHGSGFLEDVTRYANQNFSYSERFLDWQFEQSITLAPSVSRDNITNALVDARTLCPTPATSSEPLSELHPFRGILFSSSEISDAFDVFYFHSRVVVPNEQFSDGELVFLADNYEREVFKKNNIYAKRVFSVEKNMNFMLNRLIFDVFGGVKYIFDLFSDGYQKFEIEYYRLKPAAEHFFSQLNDSFLDFDTFFEYFRWIDNSVGKILGSFVTTQFSATKTGRILRNTVSSHALEREKYWWKRVNNEFPDNNLEGVLLGAEFLNYNWKIGHYDAADPLFLNTLFWKERAHRSLAEISSGNAIVDGSRESIRSASIGGEDPSYILAAKTRPYLFSAGGGATIGGLSIDIEPCSLRNTQNTNIFEYSSVPPAGLSAFATILRESAGISKKKTGNFTKNYQVVHSGGRSSNNLGFRRDQWVFVPSIPAFSYNRVFFDTDWSFFTNVSSFITAESYGFPREINRKKTDSIFVTTFCSPGDRTTSEGFRDRESLEFCSYSTVNYRNFVVRKDLDKAWVL